MTQDQARENLLKLHDCVEEFTLVFSGRKNRRIEGSYYPASCKIVINNRNFEDGEAGSNRLFETAMHELAHHIQHTEHGQHGRRCHTKLFWSIRDGLAEKAEELGLYRLDADPEVKKLIGEAAAISAEIAALQRKLGRVLDKLHGACNRKGIDYEDAVSRKVKLSPRMDKKIRKIAATQVPEGTGFEMQEAIAAAKSEGQRDAALRAAAAGKSVAQAKQAAAGAKAAPDELDALAREEKRIKNTIASLQRRLSDILKRIAKLEGGGG